MIDLTDQKLIEELDPQGTLSSTEQLVKQCEHAWNEVFELSLPDFEDFRPQNIVFCGMGASMYGALVTKSLFGRNLPVPIEIVSDYHVPSYVNSNTLVILTSYSGTTEETVSCGEDALAQGAKIVVLTKGGDLEKLAKEHDFPSYIFDGKLNTAGVPRLGNGYTIIGLLALLSRLSILPIDERKVSEALKRMHDKLPSIKENAKAHTAELEGKIPVVLAAEHLLGNAHILRNQFNETSKTFSASFPIPDLNHHLMEGLSFPKDAPLMFLSLTSENYAPKILKRFELTRDVITQNGYKVIEVETSAQTVYDDFLELMVYGSFLTLYLGLSYKQNPAINPWVDYFKEKLSQ